MSPTVGSLFAGIGGFDLGLEAVGYRAAWAVEVADFPREVLAARWPDVDLLADVREVTNPPPVDVLTGGFPCQDLSLAGHGAGIGGARSGLWGEYARIIGEVEPALVLIENVPALLRRGFEAVVRDLTALGYRVEWDCIPAAAFGAPHLRDRVWIAAHRQAAPVIFNDVAELSFFAERWADRLPAEGWARWPRAGFVDGEDIHPLEPMAPVGAVKGGGWPTPDAGTFGLGHDPELFLERREREKAKGRNGNGMGTPLAVAVTDRRLWPTAAARDAKGPSSQAFLEGRDGGPDLAAAVAQWPTPRASGGGRSGDAGGGGEGATYRRTPSQQAGTHGLYLQTEAIEAEIEAGRLDEDGVDELRRSKGALNPDWVEWLMGFPLGWTDPANDGPYAHPWALGEPPGVPRVTTDNNRRNARLTALGNALVPQAAAWLGARARGMFPPSDENTGA